MIRFSCPTCRTALETPDSAAGRKVFCPKCNQKLLVLAPPRAKTTLGLPLSLLNKTVYSTPVQPLQSKAASTPDLDLRPMHPAGRPTVVRISAQIIQWPPACACCNGYADASLTISHTRTWGKRVLRSESKSWEVPYCRRCLGHGRLLDAAEGLRERADELRRRAIRLQDEAAPGVLPGGGRRHLPRLARHRPHLRLSQSRLRRSVSASQPEQVPRLRCHMIRCHDCGCRLTPETAVRREVVVRHYSVDGTGRQSSPSTDGFIYTSFNANEYGMADLCANCAGARDRLQHWLLWGLLVAVVSIPVCVVAIVLVIHFVRYLTGPH